MKVSVLVRSILVVILYNLFVLYIGWNAWMWLHTMFEVENKWILTVIVVFSAYSFIISRAFQQVSIFKIVGSYWLGFIQYSVLLLPISNLAVYILTLLGASLSTAIDSIGFFIIAAFLFIFAYGTYNAYSPVVRKYTISLAKKTNRKNLRIAVASDMHFGTLSGKKHLQRLITHVQKIQPDLILLPGDIIDDDPHVFFKKEMDSMMKQLKAPLGTYGILGNHEYYGGKIPQFVERMKEMNIPILMDEVLNIGDSLYLIGRKDKTDKNRDSFFDLASETDRSLPVIAMDHQPLSLKEAEQAGVDLLLCGHTHRGQMAPNHLITKRLFEIDWGYKQNNQLHTIVSSGFGFWGPPLRIGSRSEIIQIDISFTK